METLALMLKDTWKVKVGDYCYVCDKRGLDLEGDPGVLYKRKIKKKDLINWKLGLSYKKVFPNSIHLDYIFRVKIINKYHFECETIYVNDI